MISKRIKKIASYIPPYKIIADIGCDHGYLILHAIEECGVIWALGIDNKRMPLESAKKNTIKYQERVSLSQTSGFDAIDENIEAVVISGMGGTLIANLIDKGAKDGKLASIKRLIIQPNRNAYDVRLILTRNGFEIVDEGIVYEDDKYYEIIIFEKAIKNISYSKLELCYGPVLLQKKDPLFIDKIRQELNILKQIQYQTLEIANKIKEMEEITC